MKHPTTDELFRRYVTERDRADAAWAEVASLRARLAVAERTSDALRWGLERYEKELRAAEAKVAAVERLADDLLRGGTLAPNSWDVTTHPQAYLEGWSDGEDACARALRAALREGKGDEHA